MNLGRGLERTHGFLALVQCTHAVDLDGDCLLQRRPDGPRLGGASRLAQNAIGALARIQFRRLHQLLQHPVGSSFCRHDHRSHAWLMGAPSHRRGETIADWRFASLSDAS
jgi:hypothetical protein